MSTAKTTELRAKSKLGQFFTPASTARFLAELFPACEVADCRLLDAGAGIGSLTSAFLDRCASGELHFDSVKVDAFEIDGRLHEALKATLERHAGHLSLSFDVVGDDFIEQAVNRIQFGEGGRYTHAILNPPYRKIRSDSPHRRLLRAVGIETGNLYSAFVALALELLVPGGQLVAIIPRSFCNGPYFRPFRDFLFARAAIRHIHLFAARDKAFRDDDVLQENVILLLERGGSQGDVNVSTSQDDSFTDLTTHAYPFERIVFPDDPERFIHVPTSPDQGESATSSALTHALADLGVEVSTGPVVDFRMKAHLRAMPGLGTAPLLYPAHFAGQALEWPKVDMKKPNAIQRHVETERWLYPNGFYCVVRRFSSKEERRRIVASVVTPSAFPDAPMLGFENHLNVFHAGKRGLPEALVRGLAAYLNTTTVDVRFRRFSGHTQVNATDLRRMTYPSREVLVALGKWAGRRRNPTQEALDAKLAELIA